MITKNNRFQCDICGKFVPYQSYYTWTYYGDSYSTEPPDPNHAHIHCYESLKEDEKYLMRFISWIKPILIK